MIIRTDKELIKEITDKRKANKSALSTQYQMSRKEYLSISNYLFDTFDNVRMDYLKDTNETNNIVLTIGY